MPRLIAMVATLCFSLAGLSQTTVFLKPFHSPVSIEQTEFGPNGSLRSVDVSNFSGQTITAIQFGCFIVHVDGRITTVVGKDNPIRGGMRAGDRLLFGRQNLADEADDALQFYYFVSRVTYDDGTSWKAPLEALKHQIYRRNDKKNRPLTPA